MIYTRFRAMQLQIMLFFFRRVYLPPLSRVPKQNATFLSQIPNTASRGSLVCQSRRTRRQRNLDTVEIPECCVTITDELLGKGGFGAVYIADYNGWNAAAKVCR